MRMIVSNKQKHLKRKKKVLKFKDRNLKSIILKKKNKIYKYKYIIDRSDAHQIFFLFFFYSFFFFFFFVNINVEYKNSLRSEV